MSRDPLIAIVGRPNVGKSTFFNRLVGGRPALVHDTPGLTRDRRYGEFEYFGYHFRVVDTGGLDPDAEKDVIGAGIHRQARAALSEADAVILVVDATAGITPLDHEVATMVRKLDKPTLVAANKVDSNKRESLLADLYELGLAEMFPTSAVHGRGVDDLLDRLVQLVDVERRLPGDEEEDEDEDEDRPLRIAFVGKPNAGKSSLVNRLLGTDRVLVHDVAGTTTDPVDTPFELDGNQYVLVDTAGIRRKVRGGGDLEKISVAMARSQIRRADVVVLVIDAHDGVSEQDARLAGMIEDAGRAVVIGLNKSDLLKGAGAARAVIEKLGDEIRFLSFAPYRIVSAKRGDGVLELISAVREASSEHRRRVPTAELNRFFAEVCEGHPPPVQSGRVVRIHYLTQARVAPPTFLLFCNHPKYLAESYKRFLKNQMRKRYGFRGTPLKIVVKKKGKGARGDAGRG